MALAVPFSPPAMEGEQTGLGAGAAVHPFFTTQRGRSREPPEESTLDFEGTVDGAGDVPGGTRKVGKIRKRSPEKGIQQSTLNFGQSSQRSKTEGVVGENPLEYQDAGDNALAGRGKRQRTESLERPVIPHQEKEVHHLNWEEQLIQAGFGGSSPAKHADSTQPAETQLNPPVEAPSSKVVHEAAAQGPSDVANSEPKVHTPAKKVMKLRMDGKLVSPKAKDDGRKKTRGKRKSGETAAQERWLLTIKYGSDETSRIQLGRRIDDILSGTIQAGQSTPYHHPAKASVKPAQAKVTHPFFLGKVARIKQDSLPPPIQEDSDVATSGPERPKSPNKPASSLKSSWAGFGSSFTKPQRLPGALEAIWPPKDMVHCRGPTITIEPLTDTRGLTTLKKLKGSATRLEAKEDVLRDYQALVGRTTSLLQDRAYQLPRHFHRPGRKLLTGEQLVSLVGDQLACREIRDAHPAIAKLCKGMSTSLSAFDRFECENQEWAHKYAPKNVTDVLCHDANMLLLRDWIVGLTINTVNTGSDPAAVQRAAMTKKIKARAKKKRKISDGLDDFVVSSEDDLGKTDEISDPEDEAGATARLPRLSQRNVHRARAVVLNGPHGCGKTASVYAIAQELGFEVFEINSGTRRSGRDILDRVGDMTRNHLVRQLPDEVNPQSEEDTTPALDAQAEVDSGRQSTMNSFFKASGKLKTKPKAKSKQTKLTKEPEKKPETPKKPSRKQKQSLILLEEVDVLFEEDKQFWSTVLTLLLSSRRPVIMTCTDETTLPVADMVDVAMLRMASPSEDLVVDYLLLLAANEGHLISSDAMKRLFHLSGNDLRASIAQLDFLCQMALGDTKGGLEWMLIRSNVKESQNERGEALRVISDSTFTRGMTTLMPDRDDDNVNPRRHLQEELYLLQDVYSSWQLEAEDWINAGVAIDPSTSIHALQRYDAAADALSAADILPGVSFLDVGSVRLNAASPPITDKERSNYPTDRPLLDTPVVTDPTSMASDVVLTVQLLSRALSQPAVSLSPNTISSLLSKRGPSISTRRQRHAAYLTDALQPLTIPAPTYLGQKTVSRLPATLPRVLATDIAPYVRSIVAADLKLEEHRLRLSGLMTEGSGGKPRRTRASRAALEGGRKESTRRERWFRREVNYRDVQKTGKEEWEDAAEKVARERKQERGREKQVEEAQSQSAMAQDNENEATADEEVDEEEEADVVGEGDVAAIGETGAKGQVAMELD